MFKIKWFLPILLFGATLSFAGEEIYYDTGYSMGYANKPGS